MFSTIHRYISFCFRPEPPVIIHPDRILFLTGGHLSELIASTSIIQSVSNNFPTIDLALASPQPFISLFQSDSRLSYLFPIEGKNTYSLKWDTNVLQAILSYKPDWIVSLHPNASNLATAFWSVTKFGLDNRPIDKKGASGFLNYSFTIDDYFHQQLPDSISKYFQLDRPKLILSENGTDNKIVNWKMDKTPRIVISIFRSKEWDLWYDLLQDLSIIGLDVLILSDQKGHSRIIPDYLSTCIHFINPESDLRLIASLVASSNICISTTDGIAAIASSYKIPSLRLNSNKKKLWLNDFSTVLSKEITSKKELILSWIHNLLSQNSI